MNTPAHLLIGAAAGGRKNYPGTTVAALLGSLVPDLSLYVMVAVSIWVMGIPAETVFRELYYSDAWQAVFAVDNSFIVWSVALRFFCWRKSLWGIAFCVGGLLHLVLDFPFHTHDARMHFWPVSTWVFESPISYWDRNAYANVVGPVEVLMAAGATLILIRRGLGIWLTLLFAVLFLMELLSSGIWQFVF